MINSVVSWDSPSQNDLKRSTLLSVLCAYDHFRMGFVGQGSKQEVSVLVAGPRSAIGRALDL